MPACFACLLCLPAMHNISVSSVMSESCHLMSPCRRMSCMTCIAAASDVAFVVSPQLPKVNAQQAAANTCSHLQHSCATATKLCTVVRLKRASYKQLCCSASYTVALASTLGCHNCCMSAATSSHRCSFCRLTTKQAVIVQSLNYSTNVQFACCHYTHSMQYTS